MSGHRVERSGLIAVLGAIAAVTQSPAQPQLPTFRTEANYVRVDAYPTKGGAPVDDLTRDDFEILENGQPQKLEQFERILIRGNVPQDQRRGSRTRWRSRGRPRRIRARECSSCFSTSITSRVEGSHNIRKPLVDTLDRLMAADDVVAVMTPEMPAASIAFARKTTTIEGFLTRHWPWGERNTIATRDRSGRSISRVLSGTRAKRPTVPTMTAASRTR